jgi:serine phosphatase RsbU (regulator of sigma subunit)/anti-sigma regulatory factor (Ser/Thr protein kinase)
LTEEEGLPDGADRYGQARKAALARYGFAVVATLAAVLTALVLLSVTDTPVYALLVGAVAVTVWYGGFGPGLVAVTIGWALSFVLFVGEPASLDLDGEKDLLPWSAGLIVVLGIVWVSDVMRRGQERAATAAVAAEASIREVEALQGLASALSAALTQTDVVHALIERTPGILGARGGAIGLVDGEELVVIDPQGVRSQTHPPGLRLPLAMRAPIVQAVVEAQPIVVSDRTTFEVFYPDGAALTPYAQAALAVPLLVEGEVVGSMSFLFDRTDAMHEDAEAVVQIVAGLGGQALERARLYDRERQSRQALDRILRVAPRFHADTAEEVHTAICREARRTFGAHVAVLWRVSGHRLQLVWSDPVLQPLAPGLEVSLEDFPALLVAVENQRVAFVADVQEEGRDAGLERARRLGIHSSLRVPIAVAGQVGHVVTISWESVVSEPDRTTTVIAQRFADQAGLALEELERRRAQAEAARRADQTRRLQEVTAALALGATAADVSNTCLEHALAEIGAEAGFVVLANPEGVTVDLVTSRGYSDTQLETWRGFGHDSDMPMWRAIASGEPVWALTAEEMAGFGAGKDLGDQGWVALPLKTSAGVRGALHLSFRRPRELDEEQRRWLQAVVSQCAQALERSRLFDEEQFLRRRSEQLQGMTAALSNALTRADVGDVVVEQIGEALGASGTALAILLEDRQLVKTLAWRGYSDEAMEPWLEVPLDTPTPGNRAVRRRVSAFYETFDELRSEFSAISEELARIGHASFLFVPLVVGREANGLLSMSWAEPHVLSAEERGFVESLASQAAQALDRASRFESERTVAETFQRSILPSSLPQVRGIQLAARYLPGTAELEVGGDWFDAIALQEGRIGLVVGDVVGKGVQAAATMAQLRNALRAFAFDRMNPSSTLARLNRLAEETFETTFATIVYAILDRESRICRFTAAGHPPPLIAYPDGGAELLEGGRGLPLGAGADSRYRHDTVEMPVGSVLLLYTDGLVERRDRPIDDGLELLHAAVVEGPRDPEQLIEHILERLVGSGERGDDIAVLAVGLQAVAPEPLHVRVPRNVDSLDLVRDSLRTWLEGTSLGESDARDVVLATWEACANAVEHARDSADDYMSVSAILTESAVRITVQDTGGWAPPTERSDRGLGLRLIRSTMSSVDIESEEGGTRVTFEKSAAGAGGQRLRRAR